MESLRVHAPAIFASSRSLKRAFRVLCVMLAFFVAAGASFSGFYTKFHFREPYPPAHIEASPASLDVLLTGTGARPYIYRQLIPMLANAIDSAVPAATKTRLYEMRTPRGKAFREHFFLTDLARNQVFYLRYLVVYGMTFIAALVATCLLYRLVKKFVDDPLIAVFAAIMMILLLPFLMNAGGYFYDYFELVFLSLTVLAALEFKWMWLIPIALFATWNKESYLLYTPCIYPLLRTRLSRKVALVAGSLVGITSLLVVLVLRLRFKSNPGPSAVEFHLFEQLHYFSHPLTMLIPNDSTYGLICPPSLNPFSLIFIVLVVKYGWQHIPVFLRRHTIWAAAINFPLYLSFCYPGELRDLSFLYIPFLVMIAKLLEQSRAEARSVAPASGALQSPPEVQV